MSLWRVKSTFLTLVSLFCISIRIEIHSIMDINTGSLGHKQSYFSLQFFFICFLISYFYFTEVYHVTIYFVFMQYTYIYIVCSVIRNKCLTGFIKCIQLVLQWPIYFAFYDDIQSPFFPLNLTDASFYHAVVLKNQTIRFPHVVL